MVAWTPDGGGILFSRQWEGTSTLYVLPVMRGKPAGEARLIRTAPLPSGKSLGLTSRGALIHASHEIHMDAWVSEFNVQTGRLGKRLIQFPAKRIGVMMMTSALKFSPDGKEFFCGAAHNGIRIQSTATGQERTIMPQMSRMNRADWAPDGKSLLVVGSGDDGRDGIYRVDSHTGHATFMAAQPSESFIILWCGDGKTFYYADRQRRIIRRDAATGTDKVLLDDPAKLGDGVVQADPSPDRQKLGIRGKNYFGILDLATGQLRDVYQGRTTDANSFWGLDWSADGQYLVTIARPDPKVQSTEIRVYPINGAAPVVTKTPVELRGLSVSADGKHIGSVSYSNRSQVWILENFLPSGGK
jgi:WD40 repeat protein